MKKIFFCTTLILSSTLASCDNEKEIINEEIPVNLNAEEVNEEEVNNLEVEEASDVDANAIDTSVFLYAKDVSVTDARDISKHLTFMVDLNDYTTKEYGTYHILLQTYDLLQQQDISGAETITVFIRKNNVKVFQFTVDVSRFATDDSINMAKLVLNASSIEMSSDEINEFLLEMGV